MTKNEKRLLKYRAVRNATGDSKIANQARSWSNKRIEDTYGITLPDNVPKLKHYADSTVKRKQRTIRKYQYAKNRGLTNIEIKELDRFTFKEIETASAFKIAYDRPMDIIRKRKGYDDKYSQWKDWAREDNLPNYLKELAYKINSDAGYDVNTPYGFMVVFYSYTRNEPVTKIMKNVEVDPFDGNRYVTAFG